MNARSPWVRRLVVSLTILVWIAIIYVVVTFLSHITLALILMIIAGLLAYIIYPLVHLLQRVMPRLLAVLVVYVLVLGALSLLIYAIAMSLVGQLQQFISYVQLLFTPAGQQQVKPIVDALQKIGISQDQIAQFGNEIVIQLRGLLGSVVPFVSQIFNIFIEAIVVATLSVYLLLDGGRAIDWVSTRTPLAQRDHIKFFVGTVNHAIGGYFRGMLILATIGGVSTGIFLALLGIPFAALLGIVVFVFYFIPVIGGYISGPLCILVAIPQGPVTILLVVLVVVVLQQIVLGQILAPRILGEAVGLHPVIAIFALFAFSELFGVFGGILAVPVAGVLQSLLIAFWNRWHQLHPELFSTEPEPHAVDADKQSSSATVQTKTAETG
jgi:predicted PurR-regulated permease PerM